MISQLVIAIILVLGGVFFSYYQYFISNSQISLFQKPQRLVLFSLISISFLFLAAFIYNPRFTQINEKEIKPSLGIVLDNTTSVPNSFEQQLDYQNSLQQFNSVIENLSEQYQIEQIILTDSNETNLGSAFQAVQKLTYSQNPVAYLIASDGQHNTGAYPSIPQGTSPVYLLGLGDSIQGADYSVGSVLVNPTCMLNDIVPIQAYFNQSNTQEESANIQLLQNNTILLDTLIEFNQSNIGKIEFPYQANSSGLQVFQIKIEELENERIISNNSTEFSIQVNDIDATIGIAFNTIHPDIKAIRNSIESFPAYQVKLIDCTNEVPKSAFENLDVLFQFGNFKIPKTDIPTLYFGTNYTTPLLNSYISSRNGFGNLESKTAYLDSAFNRINLSGLQWINKMPPISIPFGVSSQAPNTEVLLYQSIGSAKTDYPLLSFQLNSEVPSGIFFGKGIYKWKSVLQIQEGSTESFDAFIESVLRLLRSKEENSLKLSANKISYQKEEQINFSILSTTSDGEFAENEIIELVLTNNESTFTYQAVQQANSYQVSIPSLPKGTYIALASKSIGDQKITSNTVQIQVSDIKKELQTIGLRAGWMSTLASNTGGNYFSYPELSQLEQEIRSIPNTPLYQTEVSQQQLTDFIWLMVFPILFGGAHWYLRKRWSGN